MKQKYHVDIWERNRPCDTPIENVYKAESPKEVIDFFGLREPDVERFEIKEVVAGSGWRNDPESKYAPIGSSKKQAAGPSTNQDAPIYAEYKEHEVRNHGRSVVIVGKAKDGRELRIEVFDDELAKIWYACEEAVYEHGSVSFL